MSKYFHYQPIRAWIEFQDALTKDNGFPAEAYNHAWAQFRCPQMNFQIVWHEFETKRNAISKELGRDPAEHFEDE